jgi:hypothetical protein
LMAMTRSGLSAITIGPDMPPAWRTCVIRTSASSARTRAASDKVIADVPDRSVFRRDRVEPDHLLAMCEQAWNDGAAEKAARARDQDALGHGRSLYRMPWCELDSIGFGAEPNLDGRCRKHAWAPVERGA